MPSIDWRQIAWRSIILHVIYVWIVGLAAIYLLGVLGLADSTFFARLPLLIIALSAIWMANRVAVRAGRQQLIHGLLVGLLVGLVGLLLTLTTTGLGVIDLIAFLLYSLGGFLGGRMAQHMPSAGGVDR